MADGNVEAGAPVRAGAPLQALVDRIAALAGAVRAAVKARDHEYEFDEDEHGRPRYVRHDTDRKAP